jgi:hypothetical protein
MKWRESGRNLALQGRKSLQLNGESLQCWIASPALCADDKKKLETALKD